MGAEDSKTRDVLLDAAAQLMLEEGYAAATSRRVAARAGMKPALVHYYFRTMDDLFLALFRRGAEANLERLRETLASPHPVRALWEASSEPRGTALQMEFAALANHRKAIRAEIAAYAERFREAELATLTEIMRDHPDRAVLPPMVLTLLMASISRILVMEKALGMKAGHAEIVEFVDRQISRLEALRPDGTVGSDGAVRDGAAGPEAAGPEAAGPEAAGPEAAGPEGTAGDGAAGPGS
jgi:AcrR family transcriptional regulator